MAVAARRALASVRRRLREASHLLRGVAYRGYYRVARLNYERELLARRNRTPAGSFRCFEPLNRHGDDAMLAELDASCGPGTVVYDVGANVGIYALALTSEEPDRRVVAFEPAPATAAQLRANVRLNDLADRIDVLTCGLGDENGERPFYVSTHPELSAFERPSATRWEAGVREMRSVPVHRLDELAEVLPPPDAIKVDVEGAAASVLRGGAETLANYRPALFVEVHETDRTQSEADELRSVLRSLEYDVRERTEYWRCEPR